MNAVAPYTIGAQVACKDGECGELSRVIVNPVARVVTHLVVEPDHLPQEARLVPVNLVDSAGEQIVLNCDAAWFDRLEHAQEDEFLPAQNDELGYDTAQARWLPFYPLGGGLGGVAIAGTGDVDAHGPAEPQLISYDRVPAGEVQVRRGQRVHAVDGDIGHVRGLVVDPADNHVTHVLLDEGHLWGKKEVAIPIGAVTAVTGADAGIELSLAKDAVRDLPPVDIARL